MHRRRSRFIAILVVSWVLRPVGGETTTWAAGHPDLSVISIGAATVDADKKERLYRLAVGADGPIEQPFVMIASQPRMVVARPAPLDPAATEGAETEKKPVPARLKITVGDKALPEWVLEPHPTAYVINLATLRANPAYPNGILSIRFELESAAPSVTIATYAMPDPRVAGETQDGPLNLISESASDGEAKAYLSAVARDLAGEKTEARSAYERLTKSPNEAVARFARRGLRLLSYEFRPRRLTGNFDEHYRWALYLRQCGFHVPGHLELEDCARIYPDRSDVLFHAGQAADRRGAATHKILVHLLSSAMVSEARAVNDWYVLFAILEERGGKKIPLAKMAEIKNQFIYMQGMVWGATRGLLRIIPTFYIVHDEAEWGYSFRGGRVLGPGDRIVRERGWFDSVFSVLPDSPDGLPMEIAMVGPDEGPNGAAMSCLPEDSHWDDYLVAFYQQLLWAARVGEIGDCYPDETQVRYSGPQPTPNRGYGYRASLHDGFTDVMLLRAKLADQPAPGSYLRLWKIEGPFEVKADGGGGEGPSRHVLKELGSAPQALSVVSEDDFVNLKRLFPKAGHAMARATCWVYSPAEQDVRMWLGQNDGAAVWVNGRCTHTGAYYSAHQFADRNLVDTVAGHARLREGWNEVSVVVESWPAPRDKGWGFSLRFCDWNNRPLPGLAYVNDKPKDNLAPREEPPKVGPYYRWADVRENYLERLPRLSGTDWETLTGVRGTSVTGKVRGADGYFAIFTSEQPDKPGYRAPGAAWEIGRDFDVRLNNVMDWAREDFAALRYKKNGKDHDLLIVKPRAIDAVFTILKESPEAATLFTGKPLMDRLLGYAVVANGSTCSPVLVIDTLLGSDKGWPADEEELLNPIPPRYVPNKNIPQPPNPSR